MNKRRRKDIERAKTLLDEALDIITNAKDDEQAYRDNMPDGIAESEKGGAADEAIAQLEEAEDDIETAIAKLETAMEQ